MLVHAGRGSAAVAHRQNNGSAATYNVAARKNVGNGALQGFGIHLNGSPAAHLQIGERLRNKGIGRNAHTHHYGIGIDQILRSFYGSWRTTPAGIGFAQLHFLETDLFHLAFVVAQILNGVVEGQKLHAFFLGVLYFLYPGGHFFQRATVNDGGLFGPQTQGGTHGVHGGIATTNHRYTLTTHHGRIHTLTRGAHQVHAGEVLVGAQYAHEVFTGDVHETGQTSAAADEETLETFLAQIVNDDGLDRKSTRLNSSHVRISYAVFCLKKKKKKKNKKKIKKNNK